MNSPNNYDLTCSCKTLLGPLGRFRVNEEGWRSILCPTCNVATLVKDNVIQQAEQFRVPARGT